MLTIDPQRLLDDLHTLRSFGARGAGVVRTALSKVDMRARYWLMERFGEAGLDATLDAVGNVMGKSHTRSSDVLLIGSHTDTQPTGGWLDGSLGVIYGLEIARAVAAAPDCSTMAVDVVSWSDEEGTFLHNLGARAACGELDIRRAAQACNGSGETLSEALETAGLRDRSVMRLEHDRYRAYLEAHIEQGPYLEKSGCRIGVVTGIVGIRDLEINVLGEQNHAGTTPMALRRDAGAGLLHVAHLLNELMQNVSRPETVWTIGNVVFEPGAPSIIPGKARMQVQIRDPDDAYLDGTMAAIEGLIGQCQRSMPVDVRLGSSTDKAAAVPMDSAVRDHVARAAETLVPGAWQSMASGAGHDAQILARHMPAGMLFIPSIGGISHDFAEDTDEADIVMGCRVAAKAATAILSGDWEGGAAHERV